MAKTRKPTDSTLRNVRAANEKIRRLAARVKALEARYHELCDYLSMAKPKKGTK